MLKDLPVGLILTLSKSIENAEIADLRAVTLEYNQTKQHLRLDFFFSCLSSDVNFSEIEFGIIGQAQSTKWDAVRTIGFSATFDWRSTEEAMSSSSRIYPVCARS